MPARRAWRTAGTRTRASRRAVRPARCRRSPGRPGRRRRRSRGRTGAVPGAPGGTGCPVDGGEQFVQEVARGAGVAGQAHHAVGREVRAVLGDDVQQGAAPGAGGSGETDRASTGEEPHQSLAFVLALQQRRRPLDGPAGTGGRRGGARGPFSRGVLHRPPGPRGSLRRPDFYLAAVDRVDGQQQIAGHQLDGSHERGYRLSEVRRHGIPRRALTRRVSGAVVAVLLGSRVVRVHRS